MDDKTDLIERLLTAAGMIMEDSVAAALIRAGWRLDARLQQVSLAAQDIACLTEAAEVLHRRWNDTQP